MTIFVAQTANPEILKEVYQGRLERMPKLLSQHEVILSEVGKTLLRRTIFAAFYSLRKLGYEEEASVVLINVPEELPVHPNM